MHSRRINPPASTSAAQRCRHLALVAASITLSLPSPAAGIWGGSIGAASDYVSRGITLSSGEPSVQADGHYVSNSGWFAGASAARVRQAAGSGGAAELSAYFGSTRAITANWTGRMTAAHYAYPGIAPREVYDYDELSASLVGRNRWFLSVAVSPDRGADTTRGTVSKRTALAYDLILRQPLAQGLSASLGMGYNDLHRLVGVGYLYWNAGLTYERGPMHVALTFIGTDATAKSLFYDNAAANRLVATVLWSF